MPETNSRTPRASPGQTPDVDEWVRQAQSVQEEIEKDYVERLRKQQPETSGALQELRRRYDAGEMAVKDYLKRRLEIRRTELRWL
ncbi:MAG: hypothetical protein ACE5JL_11045 [Dehalococcoidia bacterium]